MDASYLTNVPNIEIKSHSRTPSLSPSRSPTRQLITDDILSDLSPATTLEAFTSDSPSGKLRASVEAATPSERAFGIRSTLASKKIQEWVDELKAWPWPEDNASAGGFEVPAAKRIKLDPDLQGDSTDNGSPEGQYMGSLPARDVLAYERRIDEIQDDMEDLDVEGIKKYVLNTHFSPRSRPSSSASEVAPMPSVLLSYTKIDDFTAIVTATVLRSLPYLSQLMRLMDVWSIRLSILRKVPPLLGMLDDAENALKSGWQAISLQNSNARDEEVVLDRKSFETMRDVLQDIVTTLGRDLDYMLDTLEGRQDMLPELWLDRMEGIEREYGEWVVAGDRRVREGEWARMAKMRKEEEEKRRIQESNRLEAERIRRAEEDRLRFEEEARGVVKLEYERRQKVEADRLLAEEESREATRLESERIQKLEEDRLRVEEEAAKLEAQRLQNLEEERLRTEQAARLEAERLRKLEEEQLRTEQAARLEAERLRKLEEHRMRAEQEAQEAAKLEADRLRVLEEERLRAEEQATKLEAERVRKFEEDIRKAEEACRESARLEEERAIEVEIARKEEQRLRLEGQALELEAEQARKDKEEAMKQGEVNPIEATSLQEQHMRIIFESKALNPYNEVGSTDAELLTLGPLKSIELPPQEYQCHDPDHDVSEEKPSPPVLSDLLIAAGASSLAAALGMKVHDFDTHAGEEEPSARASSPISRYAPFDGTSESKIADSETVHSPIEREHENDIPLRIMQRDLQIPHDAVLVSMGKTSVSKHLPKADSDKSSPPPSPNRLNGSKPTSVSPISPLTSKFEGMPSLPNHWEDDLGTSASSLLPMSEPRSLPDFTTQFIVNGAPSTPTSSTHQRQANGDEHASSSSMTDEESTGFVSDESEDPPLDEAWTPTIEISRQLLHPDELPSSKKGHNRNDSAISAVSNMSTVSGYSASDPSPEIYQAEPAEYFRPVLSPIKSSRSHGGESGPSTPTQSRATELPAAFQWAESLPPGSVEDDTKSETGDLGTDENWLAFDNDGAHESKLEKINLLELESVDPAILAEKSPTDSINSINHLEVSRRDSVSSNGSTIITKLNGDLSFSPAPSSSRSIADATESFPDVDSPSAGRVGLRNHSSQDYSPPGSPTIQAISKRRSLHLLNSPTLIPSSPVDSPITPTSETSDTPSFPSLEISPASFSSPRKGPTADDQLQAQISSLLEKIPARIRLTSEPDTDNAPLTPFSSSQNDTLRPKKTRHSLTPSIRSSSSMSMRAPTPSFTLAPAYGKSAPRPKHQNGNPEIKLYHLSRSTGEAPIKLFVRLVGENGERVMVRVGGGWADLGEYLREYASHHGRRVVSGKTGDDKVEIQDLPSHRNVSNSSITSTVRGNNGRSSPIPPRPNSVLERERERPMSSLFIRRTRKSVGEQSESSTGILNVSQAPSTPASPTRASHPNSNSANKNYDTPPSQRSVSRLSWTEEESVLGLAGPKSKPKAISERDAEWVESMKEKVRLASAEKEKMQKIKEGGRKSFGELEKLGGTKRLFKKNS